MGNDIIKSKGLHPVEALFNNFINNSFDIFSSSSSMNVDITEEKDRYIIEAEIPGVNKEQIQVDYLNNYLTISVISVNEINEEKKNFIRRERHSASTSRSFYLENIDYNKIRAKYKNGILLIILPKSKNKPLKKPGILIE